VLAALNGGWNHTARQMETKARTLGALDTTVVSPDGYDADGQASSAYDLAVFGRAGLRNPDFARYCSTAHASFPGDEGTTYEIANTNRLLTGADGVVPYPGLIGIKNGYTSKAGNTLVAAAQRGGRTLIVTVMHPQKGGGLTVYEEARELLDWGFDASGHVAPVGSLDALKPVSPRTAAPAAVPVPARAPAPSGLDWAKRGGIAGAVGLGTGALVIGLRLMGKRVRARLTGRQHEQQAQGDPGAGIATPEAVDVTGAVAPQPDNAVAQRVPSGGASAPPDTRRHPR
jgi:D-alanyl-D-alanine carboxypeptidase (penicillin-binding protein 5/6)